MKNLKKHLFIGICALFAIFAFTSAGAPYDNRVQNNDDSRVRTETKAQRKQARKEQRSTTLQTKIDQSQRPEQKARLQKRLDRMNRPKEGGNPVFGIIAGVAGGLAVVGATLFLVGGLLELGALAAVGVLMSLIFALIAIPMGIVGLILSKKKSDKFGGFGGSLAGLILGGLSLLLLLIFFIVIIAVIGFYIM